MPCDKRFYQYTCIDEASRERFLYWYDEHTLANTVDFVKKWIAYYEYIPTEIQTDNGTEFPWNKSKVYKIHPLDKLCYGLNIEQHKTRPRTPRHNGKAEKSHRNDNERFYNYLSFNSLEVLRKQGIKYLERANKIPIVVLGYKSPIEKRKELLICLLMNYNRLSSLVNVK